MILCGGILECSDGYLYATDGILLLAGDEYWYEFIINISSASITPNPATINSTALLSVAVSENEILKSARFIYYSGELYSGEV